MDDETYTTIKLTVNMYFNNRNSEKRKLEKFKIGRWNIQTKVSRNEANVKSLFPVRINTTM